MTQSEITTGKRPLGGEPARPPAVGGDGDLVPHPLQGPAEEEGRRSAWSSAIRIFIKGTPMGFRGPGGAATIRR